MPHTIKLAGDLCALAVLRPEYAEDFSRWQNDPAVTVPLGDEAHTPWPLAATAAGIENAISRGEHVFGVVDRAGDRLIGRVLLFNVNLVDRTAMCGIFIGEADYRGRGYGAEALRLLLDYAFNLLNLQSVMLGVLEFNTPALRCYEKVGFRPIGRRRQARTIAGRSYDEIYMDILAEEFTYPSTVAPHIAAFRP